MHAEGHFKNMLFEKLSKKELMEVNQTGIKGAITISLTKNNSLLGRRNEVST